MNKKIFVERETFEKDGNTYFSYFIFTNFKPRSFYINNGKFSTYKCFWKYNFLCK